MGREETEAVSGGKYLCGRERDGNDGLVTQVEGGGRCLVLRDMH